MGYVTGVGTDIRNDKYDRIEGSRCHPVIGSCFEIPDVSYTSHAMEHDDCGISTGIIGLYDIVGHAVGTVQLLYDRSPFTVVNYLIRIDGSILT